ncbi:MAG: hypothetical protein HEQ39_19310 [Rhizobacter sp.]
MKFSCLTSLSVCFVFAGCSSVAEYYRVDPILKRESTANSFFLKDGNSIDVLSTAFQTKVGEATTKEKRNEFVRQLMSVSNDVCESHRARIISNSNTWNISTGTVSNVLAGLGSVIPGESTKAALSAGAALSNSTRSLFNQEIYSNSLATTVVRAIDIKRQEAASAVGQFLETKSLAEYPVWVAIYDVDEYHRRCSFITGLIEVTKALETRKETKGQVLQRIQLLTNQVAANKALNAAYDPKSLVSEIEKLQLQLITAPE